MSKSYQHEIPAARVNITLDVETNGAKSKKELPLKLLVLGDFSHGHANQAISDRDKVEINKHNFNQVLESFSPKLSVIVPNKLNNQGEEMPVALEFKCANDFRPENLVEQIPALNRLMAMRNLLKDLKASVLDNQSFRKELEKIIRNPADSMRLLDELKQSAPLA